MRPSSRGQSLPGDRSSPSAKSKQQCCMQDKTKITYRPVHMQPLDKEMEHIPPKVRSY